MSEEKKKETKKHSCTAGKYKVEEVEGAIPRRLFMEWPELVNKKFDKRFCQVWELKFKEVFSCPFCGEKA